MGRPPHACHPAALTRQSRVSRLWGAPDQVWSGLEPLRTVPRPENLSPTSEGPAGEVRGRPAGRRHFSDTSATLRRHFGDTSATLRCRGRAPGCAAARGCSGAPPGLPRPFLGAFGGLGAEVRRHNGQCGGLGQVGRFGAGRARLGCRGMPPLGTKPRERRGARRGGWGPGRWGGGHFASTASHRTRTPSQRVAWRHRPPPPGLSQVWRRGCISLWECKTKASPT